MLLLYLNDILMARNTLHICKTTLINLRRILSVFLLGRMSSYWGGFISVNGNLQYYASLNRVATGYH
jgi:hypothetical protein